MPQTNANAVSVQDEPKEESGSELMVFRSGKFAEPLQDIIELLSQSRIAFLFGAGCSKCAGLPLMDELTNYVRSQFPEKDKSHAIFAALEQNFDSSTDCSIEDLMSELVDWASIADRRSRRASTQSTVKINGIDDYTKADLINTLSEIRSKIAQCIMDTQPCITDHQNFIKAVHGTLQAGKADRGRVVEYFTLNYDTLIEDALGLEKIPYADGFSGGTTGWWDVTGYASNAARAKIYKVHGSIDWCLLDDDVFPRRLRPGLARSGDLKEVMIWPAATKYRETQRDPFAQILDMLKATLRPSDSELVLCICGYGFGDDHINIELEQALHESQEKLTILVFISDNEPSGKLKEWIDDEKIRDQIRVYSNRGFYHGDKQVIYEDQNLPWWKFEVLARILEGQR